MNQLEMIRLTPAWAEAADQIMMAAFGKKERRVADLLRALSLQPDGFFGAVTAGTLVGMVGVVNYGPFAYLGMMAVDPNYQRRGFARRLMGCALEWCESLRIPEVRLDASLKGYPLYAELGFVEIEAATVYLQAETAIVPPPPNSVQGLSTADLPALVRLDQQIFGADRSRLFQLLLQDYPERCFVSHDADGNLSGCLFAKGCRIGPWIATNAQAAADLLQAALNLPMQGSPSLILPESNRSAPGLLQQVGFQSVSACRHMRKKLHDGAAGGGERRDWIWAQTSYAIG